MVSRVIPLWRNDSADAVRVLLDLLQAGWEFTCAYTDIGLPLDGTLLRLLFITCQQSSRLKAELTMLHACLQRLESWQAVIGHPSGGCRQHSPAMSAAW